MFGRNFDKLKTNSALKAVCRVKRRSPELQGLSCRNNIVRACAQRLLHAGPLPATARRPQRAAM